MVMKVTRWSPDTCECVIEYEWDDETEENKRVHKPVRIVHDCGVHGLKTLKEHHDAVVEENVRKNQAGQLAKTKLGIDDFAYADIWAFDENRVLHIKASKHTSDSGRKKELQNDVDWKFGLGKVMID